jgi:hypothetical protein
MAVENNGTQISRSEMTPVLQNTQVMTGSGSASNWNDIPANEVTGGGGIGGGWTVGQRHVGERSGARSAQEFGEKGVTGRGDGLRKPYGIGGLSARRRRG